MTDPTVKLVSAAGASARAEVEDGSADGPVDWAAAGQAAAANAAQAAVRNRCMKNFLIRAPQARPSE
jgi:hypothetical protein